MSLKSVQTYEVDANGVLKPIPNFVFQTDGNGSTILGGSFSDLIDVPNIGVNGSGKFMGLIDYNISSMIVGGSCNVVNNAGASFIGAGQNNYITGSTCALYFPDGGGFPSTFTHGSRSFIGGGTNNSICTPKSVIVGGHNNTIKGNTLLSPSPYPIPYIGSITGEYPDTQTIFSTTTIGLICCGPGYNGIVGGKSNCIDAIFSIIGGGLNNKIISERSSAFYSISMLPSSNLSGQFNFIGAGENLLIKNSCYSAVLGGRGNSIDRGNSSVLVGGCCNLITGYVQQDRAFARIPSDGNTLVGGCRNAIYGAPHQFIGGGANNISSGVAGSAILGGFNNISLSNESFSRDNDSVNVILGGSCNSISGGQNVILGGLCNKITSNCCSSIIGGHCNTITSNCASSVGGFRNNVSHIGAVLIGDYTSRTKTSAGNHTLSLDFASGILLRSECVPLTHTSNGISGQISFDKDYLYRHNGDHWTKVQMGTGDNLFLTGRALATYNTNYSGWANNTYATADNLFLTGSNIVATRITGVSIQDEGSNLAQAKTLNFVGAGVSASVANAVATITIAGGGGGGNVSYVSVPTTPNSAGSNGQIATDSRYFYSHNGSKWLRTALAEW